MKIETLKNIIKRFPEKPGIYRFLDGRKKPLYIGKAGNLKNRVKSYLRPSDQRIATMTVEAKNIEYIETESDIEALILESHLIKKHLPKFNIMLRDDKQYFFATFTDEEFPRIFLTHQSRSRGIKAPIKCMIGPFTEGTSLKITLKILRRIFPYCTCKQKHNVMCLNGHIGACMGFCCLKNPSRPDNKKAGGEKKTYLANIRAIRDILSGKKAGLLKRLENEMKKSAAKHDLERAIDLRATIARAQRVFENAQIISRLEGGQDKAVSENRSTFALKSLYKEIGGQIGLKKIPHRIEGYDIAHIQGTHTAGAMVVFKGGEPDKTGYRKFTIGASVLGDDTGALKEILERRLRHQEWPLPDLIIIDGGVAQLNAATSVITPNTPIVALTKNDRHRGDHITFKRGAKNITTISLAKLATLAQNLILAVDAEAHRFAIGHHRQLHKKASLT